MQSTVESLEGNKVKLHVTVPANEFDRAIDTAFRKMAREVRIPGFRPGKAPRRLLEARLGSEMAREQALRDSLPEYYVGAVTEHNVDVIAMPHIKITAGEDEGDVEFDAIVEIRPQVKLIGYDALRIEMPFRAISDEDVDAQVDALRDRFADLADSEFPLIDEAYATIDISGSMDGEPVDGLTATDFLYRVGSEMVVPELDDHLRGTRPGAILQFDAMLPERFEERAGDKVSFQVIVKEAKQKVLPELTDEWASEASEFDTVDELRADIRQRLDVMQRLQAQMALRDKVLEAVADLVPIEAPEPLVDDETRRRMDDFAHRLSHQGANLEMYLQATGEDPQVLIDSIRNGATRGVLADLALRAVVAQEEIEVTDDEVDAEVARLAERVGQKPEKLRREFVRTGALQTVRSDVARGKALQFLVEHATVVDEDGNEVSLDLSTETEVDAQSEASNEQTTDSVDEQTDDQTDDQTDEQTDDQTDEATERSQP
jgi:trigger factor